MSTVETVAERGSDPIERAMGCVERLVTITQTIKYESETHVSRSPLLEGSGYD